jgi:hypothetical protein
LFPLFCINSNESNHGRLDGSLVIMPATMTP